MTITEHGTSVFISLLYKYAHNYPCSLITNIHPIIIHSRHNKRKHQKWPVSPQHERFPFCMKITFDFITKGFTLDDC